MIDPALFDVSELVTILLNTDQNPGNWWRRDCEIVKRADHRNWPILVVRHVPTDRYLRHSKGPVQGHSWDMYGDDYSKPEWALLALSQAPAPDMIRAESAKP